jgi:hypothetical protein
VDKDECQFCGGLGLHTVSCPVLRWGVIGTFSAFVVITLATLMIGDRAGLDLKGLAFILLVYVLVLLAIVVAQRRRSSG